MHDFDQQLIFVSIRSRVRPKAHIILVDETRQELSLIMNGG